MAYGEQTVVGKDIKLNDRGEYLRTSHIKNANNEKIDMRVYYTDKNSEELKPGKQGFRFNAEDGVDVVLNLIEALGPDVREDILSALEKEENK